MPSLNLRNPLRRDPNRPTLKLRAASLKATAAKIVRKPKPLPAAGSPEAVEAFGAACRAVDAASRLSAAEMEALHVAPGGVSLWTSDKVTAAQNGDFSRFHPREVEAARATPRARLEELQILALRRELRMAEAAHSSRIRELHALVYGDEPDPANEDKAPAAGDPDPILALIEANRTAEAAIEAFGREANTRGESEPTLSAAQVDSWRAVYRTRPTTLTGLAALRDWIAWQIERHQQPPEGDGSVWADAYLSLNATLDLVLKPAEADPRLVAMVAEWQDVRRKLDDPATLDDPEADALADAHSIRQREIYLYPARSALDLLAKVPALRDELEDAKRGADGGKVTNDLPISAWTGLLADIERIAGATASCLADIDAELIALGHAFDAATIRHREACDALDAAEDRAMSRIARRPEFAGEAVDRSTVFNLRTAADGIEDEAEQSRAHARINELSATLDAWEGERDRALGDESVIGGRAVADEAGAAVAAIARQAIALPARTLPGVWVKVRIAAFYGEADPTASPEEGYAGEPALRSLYRDAPRLVLDAETANIRIVPEA